MVQQDTHVLPMLPTGNKKGNKENSSNINNVACVAHVAQEKQSFRDSFSSNAPESALQGEPSPPKNR